VNFLEKGYILTPVSVRMDIHTPTRSERHSHTYVSSVSIGISPFFSLLRETLCCDVRFLFLVIFVPATFGSQTFSAPGSGRGGSRRRAPRLGDQRRPPNSIPSSLLQQNPSPKVYRWSIVVCWVGCAPWCTVKKKNIGKTSVHNLNTNVCKLWCCTLHGVHILNVC
jgi:hypothetical protein